MLVTVPVNRKLETTVPADYPRDDAQVLQKSWGRAHAIRTALGVGAFVCAAISSASAVRQE